MPSFTYSVSQPELPSPTSRSEGLPMDEAHRQRVLKQHGVRVIGSGKPPMLLCNGLGCNQRIWHYLTAALAVQYQVIVFDYVGSGDSDLTAYDPQRYTTLAAYAQDVAAICQALDLQQATIVGHSVGASIAMLTAIQAPHHFARVVLLTPSPCYLNEPGYYGGFERADLVQVLAAMEHDYRGWTTAFADLLTGPAHATSVGEELASFFCETDSTIMRQFAQVTFFSDNRADVPHLRLPTLVVQCIEDVAGPPEVGEYLLRHLPQAQLVTLKVSGHCPHLSAPLETLTAILAFAA